MFIPSLDPLVNILKLKTEECKDKSLLLTLMFVRYCPKLLETKFEGNRGIKDSTIEFAKKINNISPFEPKNLDFISGPELDEHKIKKYYTADDDIVRWDDDGKYIKAVDIDNYLINIFRSKKFKKEFEKYFDSSIYYDISKSFDELNYFSLHHSYPIFSVLKIINDIEFSKCCNNPKLMDWFESYDKTKQLMNKTKYLIKKYGLFDYDFYKNQLNYEIDYDLLDHYLQIGYKDGKNPSKLFDGNYYLQNNDDVKKLGMNPLMHYVLYGMKENRGIKSVKNDFD